MRKIGTKLLLSLVLSASMLSISTSVLATEGVNETETVSNNNARDVGIFSDITTSDIKNYGGIKDNKFYLKNGISFYALYTDTDSFYSFIKNEDEDEYYEQLDSASITEILSDSDNFIECNRDGDYFYIGDISDIDSKKYKSFYLFIYDNNNLYNLGYFDSVGSIKDKSVITDTVSKPVLNVHLEAVDSSSVTINTEYSTDNCKIYAIVYTLDDNDLSILRLTGDDQINGNTSLNVKTNGKYTIKAYTTPYLYKDDEHIEFDIDVNSIKTSTPEEDAEKNADVNAPKVTFSAFPDSALNNTSTELTMYSDEPAILNFNGVSSNDYVTEMKFSVSENGEYNYQAQDKSGNTTSTTLKVEFFKDNTLDDFDRDSFWDDPITSGLPQTGSIGFYTLIVLGLALVVGGAFFVYNGRKKKLNTIENNETSEEQSDDTESKTEDSTDELSEQRQVLTETLKKVQEDKE